MKTQCRHYKSLILGQYEWCYQCGAFRRLDVMDHSLAVDSTWCRPTGVNGQNPWDEWQKNNAAMKKARTKRRFE